MEFSIERNDGCMRKIMTGLIPFAVILLAWMTASQAASFNDAVNSVLLVLPFVIAILAIFMSIWYKNSRFFFLTVFILLSYIILKIASSKEAMLIEAVTEISILIPINMIWLAFINERGIITSYGANKAILIGLQIVWVLINILSKSDDPTSGMLSPDHAMAIPARIIPYPSWVIVGKLYFERPIHLCGIHLSTDNHIYIPSFRPQARDPRSIYQFSLYCCGFSII